MPRHGYILPTTAGATDEAERDNTERMFAGDTVGRVRGTGSKPESEHSGGNTGGDGDGDGGGGGGGGGSEGVLWVTRDGVTDTSNSAIVAPCAPYVNDGTQAFNMNTTTGKIATTDGRCLFQADGSAEGVGKDGQARVPSSRVTTVPCAVADQEWALDAATGQIVKGATAAFAPSEGNISGHAMNKMGGANEALVGSGRTCLSWAGGASHTGPFVIAVDCTASGAGASGVARGADGTGGAAVNTATTTWVFVRGRVQPKVLPHSSKTSVCLTAVNDNKLVRAAMALTTSPGTQHARQRGEEAGAAASSSSSSSYQVENDASATVTVRVGSGKPATIYVAVVTSEDVATQKQQQQQHRQQQQQQTRALLAATNSGARTEHTATVSTTASVDEVVAAAKAMAAAAAANASALALEHEAWWVAYWNKSWVDITGNTSDYSRDVGATTKRGGNTEAVPARGREGRGGRGDADNSNTLLESYYYGSQYVEETNREGRR